MRAYYKTPGDKEFKTIVILDNLHLLQQLVGGYIETVTISTEACVICNEEGRIIGMPYNCKYEGVDYYGPIIVVGIDGDEFTDAPMSLAVANNGIVGGLS